MGLNPHVWLSVSDNIREVRQVEAAFILYDPVHRAAYQANADAYVDRLCRLQSVMHQRLDRFKGASIVTFHDGFVYLAREFGFQVAAVIEREPGTEPSSQELAHIIDLIRKYRVKAIFAETQYPVAPARTIASETSLPIFNLDAAAMGPDRLDAYIEIMTHNMMAIERALQ